MQPTQQRHLFTILERFYCAVDSIAYPLPQGFSAFFSFLGFFALDFNTFIQYIDRNVFELQNDVLIAIFKGEIFSDFILCSTKSYFMFIFRSDGKFIESEQSKAFAAVQGSANSSQSTSQEYDRLTQPANSRSRSCECSSVGHQQHASKKECKSNVNW